MEPENKSDQNKGRQASKRRSRGTTKTSTRSTKSTAAAKEPTTRSAKIKTPDTKSVQKAPVKRAATKVTVSEPKATVNAKENEVKATPKIKVEVSPEVKLDVKSLAGKKKKKYEKLNKDMVVLTVKQEALQKELLKISGEVKKVQEKTLQEFKAGVGPKKRVKLLKKLDQQMTREETVKNKIRKVNEKIARKKKKAGKVLKKTKKA